MNAEEQFLTPTTQVELNSFTFSPSFDKLQQPLFENLLGQTGHHHGHSSSTLFPALHSLLSPTSPKFQQQQQLQVSSVVNGDFDQAFAALLADTPPQMPLQSYPPPTTTTATTECPSLFELQALFSPSSSLCTSKPSFTGKVDKKPPPLKIPAQSGKKQLEAKQITLKVPSPVPAVDLSFNNDNSTNNTERIWQTVFVDPAFQGKLSVKVTSKTRCEEPSEEIPTKLYSSLKYEIRQSASGTTCSDVPFLLGRITVVDAVDFHEILKEKKSVLKGVVEGSLVKPPASADESRLDGVLKCQFTDVSYHHKKRGFCFQISYFTPNDLERPILIKRSGSFLVYARKPSQGKKRKHKETITTTATTSDTSNADNSFDIFSSRLDELVQVSKKLRTTERQAAIELVSSKLLQLDPAYFYEQLKNMQKK